MMKAMQLTALRQLQLCEVDDPSLTQPEDVLIRMQAVGVCGSDVHYYNSGRIGSQIVQFPFTVGHEGAGIVEAVAPGVTRVRPGDRIAVEPAISCRQCDQCRQGREHTCRKLRFLGCPNQAPGCLSEYIVMPQQCCFVIPATMSAAEAAFSEPLAIGVYAVQQSMALAGKSVGILGCGPIGMSVLLPARRQGAGKIYVTDKIDRRLQLARELGATWTGNVDTTDVVGAISAAEPELLDVVFECCGQQDAVDQAMHLLKPGGKLMLIGIPPELDNWRFPVDKLRHKELCIQNVRRQNHCLQPTLDMISTRDFDVNALITHHFDFADTAAAFELVESYGDGVVKAMIHYA